MAEGDISADVRLSAGPWSGHVLRILLNGDGSLPADIDIDDATGAVRDTDGNLIGRCVR